MLLRTGTLRGLLGFLDAPPAGRIARVTLFPFVLGFFAALRFAGALPLLLLLRRRSLILTIKHPNLAAKCATTQQQPLYVLQRLTSIAMCLCVCVVHWIGLENRFDMQMC